MAKHARYKLILMIISRGAYRVMRDAFMHVQKVAVEEQSSLNKLWSYMTRNAYTAQKAALQKLKENIVLSRSH
jgi:hypothetical protein